MWRRLPSTAVRLGGHLRPFSTKRPRPGGMPAAVDGVILRSLKDHYLEASKMTPPRKVNPPEPFAIVKGALDRAGGQPVLRRRYGEEEISVAVFRLASFVPEVDEDEEGINQLFLHVDVGKEGREGKLHFLCALYPDAMGIHSVRFSPRAVGDGGGPGGSAGRSFQEFDEKMKDAFHAYVEERGINESLFPFLQAWLYVKDHRNLMRWFKSVGTFVNQKSS